MANANIFSQYLQQPKSALDYSNDLDVAEARKQQNALQALTLQQTQDTMQQNALERAALRSAAAKSGGDRAAFVASLRASGMPGLLGQADAMEKAALDQRKTEADIGKTTAETAKASWETQQAKIKQAITAVTAFETPEQAIASLQEQVQSGHIDPARAQAMAQSIPRDPTQFPLWQRQMVRSIMDAAKRAEMEQQREIADQTDATSRRNTDVNAATSLANNAATVGATLRGQNLADARAREQIQQGKVPTGYRQRADGTLEFIPGGPADPAAAKKAAPTEFQGKSAAFGSRAQEADRLITELEGKYSPAAVSGKQAAGQVWGIGGALEAGANAMLSPASQQAEQAQRDFVNAILRQESGASISASEFANAQKQYFPQPGDSAQVIRQKAANRKLAVQGLLNNAGNAVVAQPVQAGPSPAPAVLRFDANGNPVK